MKNIIGLLFLILLIGSCQKKSFLEGVLPLEGEALIDLVIEENAVMGIAAGYSLDNNDWGYAAGFSNEETKDKFSTSTVTRIASLAKPMTAIAILQLFENGQLKLDSPIQEYLPDFPIKPEGAITVRHLLNHSSGISGYKNANEAENQTEYESIEAAVDIFKDRELLAIPGTTFNYSTYGYVVLGRIIETVSGQNYETYMKKNIWDIANMTNTSVEKTSGSYTNKSELYYRKDNGKIKSATPNNLSNRIPGGGIISTLDDMLKFGNGLLNNDFISKESLELMFEIQDIGGSGSFYGLGWYLGEDPVPNYGINYGHLGAQTGASTLFTFFPEGGLVIVVLINTSGISSETSKIMSNLFQIATN